MPVNETVRRMEHSRVRETASVDRGIVVHLRSRLVGGAADS